MADCDLCGVSRPTLCPVKVSDPSVSSAYPRGTWRGLSEECLDRCHEAYLDKKPANGKKCDLCGIKKVPLFQANIQVPNFREPYLVDATRNLCESCLEACEESYRRREGEKEAHH